MNISVFFGILFACSPVRFAWDKSINGHCHDARVIFLAQTALIFVLDLCIVVAPIPLVWNLHTTAGTKGAVTGLFLLGGLSVLILVPRPRDHH